MPLIPEFLNEVNPNPVVAIDLWMKDGPVLRFEMGEVQQARVMWAMGQLLANLGVELNISFPESLWRHQDGDPEGVQRRRGLSGT